MEIPMKIDKFPGVLTRSDKNGHPYILTDEQRSWLQKWFPEEENSRLIKASGMSHSTLHRFARELGLKKSEAGMKRIKKRQAAHIKRVCEKNGYYDSIRGRQPSEQCREATARMWQDIREGRREHPFAVMKRENPRKYRQYMKRKSEERRKTIRTERARMLYGLPRKTRLRSVVMQKYTRSQVCHRSNAFRRGYILADECHEGSGHRFTIYYDDSTPRSPRFEQNCQRDGFTIRQWDGE